MHLGDEYLAIPASLMWWVNWPIAMSNKKYPDGKGHNPTYPIKWKFPKMADTTNRPSHQTKLDLYSIETQLKLRESPMT